MKSSTQPKLKPRVVVRKQRVVRGPDRSAWKVAFADFTTAMMAFFLLLWLLEHSSEEQKQAIAGYFTQPAGAVTRSGVNAAVHPEPFPIASNPTPAAAVSQDEVRRQFEQREQQALEELRNALLHELEQSHSMLGQLKDQIHIDINVLGLRIQIVDKEQRPMFDLSSDTLKPYSRQVLHELAPLLDKVPNRIAISGHTDAVSYGETAVYSNWELSVDRANSARRALVEGGYPEHKVAAAQGMSDIALYKPEAPTDPSNRRIAIMVLKRFAERPATGQTTPASSGR